MLCCSTALYKTCKIRLLSFPVFNNLVAPNEQSKYSHISVSHSVLWQSVAVPFSTATTEVPDVVRTKLHLRLSVNYRFPIFFPGLGEHSGNYGWLCSGEEVCSMCADIDCSSTAVYTALSNVRSRTLTFPLFVALTYTSDTHPCMYNNNWPSSQLAYNLQKTLTKVVNDSTFAHVPTCTFPTFQTNQIIHTVSVRQPNTSECNSTHIP
jgi:hypothetical protein